MCMDIEALLAPDIGRLAGTAAMPGPSSCAGVQKDAPVENEASSFAPLVAENPEEVSDMLSSPSSKPVGQLTPPSVRLAYSTSVASPSDCPAAAAALAWTRMCCARLSERANRLSQEVQMKGLSEVCVRRCRRRCSARLNARPHEYRGHGNGFSRPDAVGSAEAPACCMGAVKSRAVALMLGALAVPRPLDEKNAGAADASNAGRSAPGWAGEVN
jgi:hypothetical protein